VDVMKGHCCECHYWNAGRCAALSGVLTAVDFLPPPDFGCERFSPIHDPILDREFWQIDEIHFDVRAINICLNCGPRTVAKIRAELSKIGLDLAE
jgi:hypothetical protein